MKTFLIVAYPRSRTLWLANFLSVPGVSICEHEATQWANSSQAFWDRADLANTPYYGNSDSAAILVLPALLAARPLTKVVWVERPLPEVAVSMIRAGFPFTQAGMELLCSHKNKYQDLFDLEIDFYRLGQLEVITTLWGLVLPEVPFDYGRWGQLEAIRLAYTAQHYADHPRDGRRFLEFVAKEGETKCPTT